jgi:hypothetical protein
MTSMPERRRYPRFTAWLPLRLKAVSGKIEPAPMALLTQNISKAGLCFPAPRRIELGEYIEVEVTLMGTGHAGKDVHVSGSGLVVRVETGSRYGWYKLAAAFGEPPTGSEPGWYKLASTFDDPSSSATNS